MGTMTKWPVQKHTEHNKTRSTCIQRRNRHKEITIFCVFRIFLFFFNFKPHTQHKQGTWNTNNLEDIPELFYLIHSYSFNNIWYVLPGAMLSVWCLLCQFCWGGGVAGLHHTRCAVDHPEPRLYAGLGHALPGQVRTHARTIPHTYT